MKAFNSFFVAHRYLLLLVSCCFCAAHGLSQTPSVVAGTGVAGYGGDGGLATAAQIKNPSNVIADAMGNIYIADNSNSRIRKVNTAGVISTIAGTGVPGMSGDGGPATAATFYSPNGLAIDGVGNIYVADINANNVRKISASGIISTIAGVGGLGPLGDGGPATAAHVGSPNGIVLDQGGNIYISDFSGNRVRKINPAGIISTYAGNGSGTYAGDGGPATNASIYRPGGICLDHWGNLYIADDGNSRIRKVDPSGIITTIAGTGAVGGSGDGGPATAATFGQPTGVRIDGYGNIYIGDLGGSVRKVNTAGTISSVASEPASGSIWVTCNGSVYISSASSNRIYYLASSGVCPSLDEPTIIGRDEAVMSIFPNPAHGYFELRLNSDASEPVQITVNDVAGRTIATRMAATNEDVSFRINSAAGLYFVTAVTVHGVWTQRVVIE